MKRLVTRLMKREKIIRYNDKSCKIVDLLPSKSSIGLALRILKPDISSGDMVDLLNLGNYAQVSSKIMYAYPYKVEVTFESFSESKKNLSLMVAKTLLQNLETGNKLKTFENCVLLGLTGINNE